MSSPLTFSTPATPTPASVPWPMNDTSTGKNALMSTPPTLNTSEPLLVSSSAEIWGTDHARECEEGSRDHSPECEVTVGYEPSLEEEKKGQIEWKDAEQENHIRKGYRDDDVVECHILVLEFVLDADFTCSIVRGRRPAID